VFTWAPSLAAESVSLVRLACRPLSASARSLARAVTASLSLAAAAACSGVLPCPGARKVACWRVGATSGCSICGMMGLAGSGSSTIADTVWGSWGLWTRAGRASEILPHTSSTNRSFLSRIRSWWRTRCGVTTAWSDVVVPALSISGLESRRSVGRRCFWWSVVSLIGTCEPLTSGDGSVRPASDS
jgi:hypothetical protein